MKVIALDYGQKRTGIAVSDAGGRMAFPRMTLAMSTRKAFFVAIARLISDEAPDCLVVGLPLMEDGSDSLTTRQVRNMTKSLRRRVSVPIYFVEEGLTSFEAEQDLRAVGRSHASLKNALDQQAAVRILASFLTQPEHARRRA